MQGVLVLLVQWSVAFVGTVGMGYLVFHRFTAWVGLVQLAYVVPLVVLANRRRSAALGVGVLCGATVVLAAWVMAGLFVLLFADV